MVDQQRANLVALLVLQVFQVQLRLAGVSERGVPEIVGERDRLVVEPRASILRCRAGLAEYAIQHGLPLPLG